MIPDVQRWISLMFSDPGREHDFAKSRMPTLIRNLRIAIMLYMLLVCSFSIKFFFFLARWSGPHQAATQNMYWVMVATLCFTLGCLAILRWYATALRPEQVERLAVLVGVWAIISSYWTNEFRVAQLVGQSPEVALRNTDACILSDSTLALCLDAVVTSVALFLPIRAYTMLPVPMVAVFSYGGISAFLGSPEGTMSAVINTLTIFVLSSMAWLGCHQTESRERRRFLEVSQARKEMVEEKVARFDLEHKIETGTRTSASSTSTPPGHRTAAREADLQTCSQRSKTWLDFRRGHHRHWPGVQYHEEVGHR